jgi:glucose-1-phosphate cytidylyltransferase
MKAVILAGGFGTRLSEETNVVPKPMIQIGGKPILWHILKLYSSHGINDFVICLGYKGYVIKEYFANYFLHTSDVTFDMRDNRMHVHQKHAEPWQITLIDTGENTGTGGRLKRVARYLEPSEPFCFTYGDGVSDIDLSSEIQFHKQNKKLVTLCAVQPPGRYGAIVTNEKNEIVRFQEKPVGDGGWINGGFFVMQPEAIEFIESDEDSWEFHVLPKIAARNQICAYEHRGFWHAMDTLRDKFNLEEMWKKGDAPWRIWK